MSTAEGEPALLDLIKDGWFEETQSFWTGEYIWTFLTPSTTTTTHTI